MRGAVSAGPRSRSHRPGLAIVCRLRRVDTGSLPNVAACPIADPLAKQAALTDAAVDRLAQQVGVTGMAGRLLDQMQEDPPQREVLAADALDRKLLET